MEKALKKTITWRCIGLTTAGLVWYAFTGSVTIGASVSIAVNLINSVLYYLHEVAWSKGVNFLWKKKRRK